MPAQGVEGPTAHLTALLAQVSRGRLGAQPAQALLAAAQHRIGVPRGVDALAFALRRLVRQVDALAG